MSRTRLARGLVHLGTVRNPNRWTPEPAAMPRSRTPTGLGRPEAARQRLPDRIRSTLDRIRSILDRIQSAWLSPSILRTCLSLLRTALGQGPRGTNRALARQDHPLIPSVVERLHRSHHQRLSHRPQHQTARGLCGMPRFLRVPAGWHHQALQQQQRLLQARIHRILNRCCP